MIQYEKSIFSQNGEDGVIEHIFDKLGTTNKIAVEFGVSATGGGLQNNTRNLANKGWQLFWFDILDMKENIPNCKFKKVKLSVDNVENEFEQAEIPIDFDLLCIDIDGNDYHLREKLKKYNPRVCVLEYNGTKLSDEEYIMPYNENYSWRGVKDHSFGSSLMSLTKLLDKLGYDLIHVENNGINAFYARKDINLFPKKNVSEVWKPVVWLKKVPR